MTALDLAGSCLGALAWLSRRARSLRGRTKLGQLAFKAVGGLEKEASFRLDSGISLTVPLASSQGWVPYFSGHYDAEEVALLNRLVRRGTVVIDIGASIGMYAVQLAKACKEQGATLHCVEPVPLNAMYLRRNLAQNGFSGVATVHEVALGREEGECQLKVDQGGVGNAAVPVSGAEHLVPAAVDVTVPMRRLDDLLDKDVQVAAIKIDVEGLELEVLDGAAKTIERCRPTILGEFHPELMRLRGVSDEQFARWLEDHAYSASVVTCANKAVLCDARQLILHPWKLGVTRTTQGMLLEPR